MTSNLCSCSQTFFLFCFQLNVPMYTTPFGPIVDGVVIPDDPLTTLTQKGTSNTFAKFDVMFGLTESEAFHLFPASLGKYSVFPTHCTFSRIFCNTHMVEKRKIIFAQKILRETKYGSTNKHSSKQTFLESCKYQKISRMVKFNIGKKSQNWLFLPHKKGKEIVMDRVVVIHSPKNDSTYLAFCRNLHHFSYTWVIVGYVSVANLSVFF